MSETPPRPSPRRAVALALLLAPVLVYVGHALVYGDWLVDDAAISFAYARSIGTGHGFVAQPGQPAVEGYSDPLWTLLLAVCVHFDLFVPPWTPKLLSIALASLAFLGLGLALQRREPANALPNALALLLTAANPCVVIWTVSGLEYGLLLALFAAALSLLIRAFAAPVSKREAALAGGVAAALALTRPDAVLWSIPWPAAVAWRARTMRQPLPWRRLGAYGGVLAGLLLAFEWHRLATFGDWLPNTFHAKQAGDGWRLPTAVLATPLAFAAIHRCGRCARASRRRRLLLTLLVLAATTLCVLTPARNLLRGEFGALHLVFLAAWVLLLAGPGPRSPIARATTVGTVVATTTYLALPADWMGHLRFGFAFFPCALLAATAMLFDGGWFARVSPRWRWLAALLPLLLIVPDHVLRARRFLNKPALPVAAVRAEFATTWERYAAALGRDDLAVLTEDVGAPLYFGRLTVVDLGGLCDAEIGRLVFRDPQALADLVFDRRRPAFVRLRRYIAKHSDLALDPRFARDYVPIAEHREPRENDETGPLVPVGDYVRRDLLRDDGMLAELRRIHGP